MLAPEVVESYLVMSAGGLCQYDSEGKWQIRTPVDINDLVKMID